MGLKVNTKPRVALGTYRVSVCKVCNGGVYSHQTWTFANRPLGISHDECLAWVLNMTRERFGDPEELAREVMS